MENIEDEGPRPLSLVYKGQPVAIVGGAADNGDTTISSLQSFAQILEYPDDNRIPGLLQLGGVAPTGDGT